MSRKVLTVALPGREYDIEIERGLLSQVGERCRALLPKAARLYVITDSNVAPLYGARAADSLTGAGFQVKTKVVPAGEASKNARQLIELWEDMMAFGLTRTDAVVMTAGIGENSAELRELIFDGLAHMGMILDRERNHVVGQIGVNRIISIDDSPIKICVVTTDEEMRIARETDNLVSQLG